MKRNPQRLRVGRGRGDRGGAAAEVDHRQARRLPEARLAEPALIDDLVVFARDALPLLEWGWSAVVDTRE